MRWVSRRLAHRDASKNFALNSQIKSLAPAFMNPEIDGSEERAGSGFDDDGHDVPTSFKTTGRGAHAGFA
jgi:hypothetical protein